MEIGQEFFLEYEEDWRSGRAELVAEPTTSDEAMVEAVKKAGYKGKVRTRRVVTPQKLSKESGRERDYDLVVIGTGGAGMSAWRMPALSLMKTVLSLWTTICRQATRTSMLPAT